MKVKRLRIHYYVEEYEKRGLADVILSVACKKEYKNLQWYIKRDWKYGPHIGIYLFPEKGNSKTENKFLKEIRGEIEAYWVRNPKEEKGKPDEKILMQLAQLEKYKQEYAVEEYLPIQPHCNCVKETISLKPEGYYNTRKEYAFYQNKRMESSRLLLTTMKVLREMEKEKQYLFLTAMFREVAECYPKEGLLRGCMSFKSHVTGFLGNADSRTERLREQFMQIYEYMKDNLKAVEQKQYDFGNAQGLICEWKEFFETFINEIYYDRRLQNRLKRESSFVEESVKNLSNYTEFHHNWVNRSGFADFFFSEEFYRYRMLVNFFYLLLPSLGFGPEEKHLGCYLITRTIEETKGISFMNMISA